MEIGEADALAGQAVEVGRLDAFRAETAEVVVALVVREDDDEIGRPLRGLGAARPGPGDRRERGERGRTAVEEIASGHGVAAHGRHLPGF